MSVPTAATGVSNEPQEGVTGYMCILCVLNNMCMKRCLSSKVHKGRSFIDP
jgi:hypothetical protein